MARTTGTVREWRNEEGWGIIDSPQTPGGCWTHFSVLVMDGYKALTPGQRVQFIWRHPGQDGFDYAAEEVWP
jgi:CspA family cold shock protein